MNALWAHAGHELRVPGRSAATQISLRNLRTLDCVVMRCSHSISGLPEIGTQIVRKSGKPDLRGSPETRSLLWRSRISGAPFRANALHAAPRPGHASSRLRLDQTIERDGEFAHAHPGRVPDRVRHRPGGAGDPDLAHALD